MENILEVTIAVIFVIIAIYFGLKELFFSPEVIIERKLQKVRKETELLRKEEILQKEINEKELLRQKIYG